MSNQFHRLARYTFIWVLLTFSGCTTVSPKNAGLDPTLISLPTMALPTSSSTQIQAPTTAIQALTNTPTPSMTPAAASFDILLNVDPELCQENWCVYPFNSPFDRPISSENNERVDPSYRYGATQGGTRKVHKGVEFVNPTGTPVHAVGNGTVIIAETDHFTRYGPVIDFYGNVIIIEHDLKDNSRPIYSLYAHLSEILVQHGQHVNTGDVIAKVGATGSALGSHLHLEIRYRENNYVSTVNPELVLPPPLNSRSGEQTGILVLQMKSRDFSVFSIPIWLKSVDDQAIQPFQMESYFPKAPRTEKWDEVGAVGDLEAGNYQLSFYKNGSFFETTFSIFPGKLTVLSYEF